MPMLQLLHRPAESADAFVPFATAARLADARDELASPVNLTPHHGDLVRVVSVRTDRLFVFDAARSSFVGVPRPRGAAPWFDRWEGSEAEAEDMLRACAAVDRCRLVLAACDCAETAIQYVPAGEDRPRIAIETARRWVRGEATTEDVRRAWDAAWAASATSSSAVAAAWAASATSSSAVAAYASSASAAAYASASAPATWGSARASSLRSMAPLVRRHIPLSVLACSIVGAADPLPIRHGD